MAPMIVHSGKSITKPPFRLSKHQLHEEKEKVFRCHPAIVLVPLAIRCCFLHMLIRMSM